jgi:hypothetical protein
MKEVDTSAMLLLENYLRIEIMTLLFLKKRALLLKGGKIGL